MATIYTMEAVNMFAGDSDPSASNHLALTQLKLPMLEENFADHVAGGAPVGIEINTHFNRPECTFNLIGWNAQVAGLIGSYTKENQRFTAYGGIRDRLTGKLMKAEAYIWGRLARANPTEFQKGQNFAHEYSIRAITHYELIFAGTQLWYWDFYENSMIIGGVDRMAEMNTALSIPGAAGAPGGEEVGGASDLV